MSLDPKAWASQLLNCIAFLTRLPVPNHGADGGFSLKDCIWCFSLVGLLVGGIGAIVVYVAAWIGLNLFLSIILVLGVTGVVTGALHEDGFADFCDGLGLHDRERALEAMRDSRIGVYGVIGLVLSLAWRGGALYQIESIGLIALALLVSHAAARGLIAPLFLLPFAGQKGLAYAAGAAGRHSVAAGLIITAICLLLLLPVWAALAVIIGALAAIGLIGFIAMRKFGGVTGDVYGAAEQAAEIAVLGVLVGFASG